MGDMSREPSMEEILSSIRRVIARDEAVVDGAVAPLNGSALNATSPANDGDGGDDIDAADDVLELTAHSVDEEDNAASADELSVPDAIVAEAGEPELVSPLSAAASRQSLDALAAALSGGPEPAPTVPANGGDMTINQLAEAALRPLLKQWLDANLPPMVERIVAREIARITGNRF
jgi:uncharacterized protein